MQAGERANHDNTANHMLASVFDQGQGNLHNIPNRQTVPETREPDVLVDTAHSSAEAFTSLAVGIELADHDIGRMGDDGAEDTGDVATRKRNAGLCGGRVVRLLAGKTVVDHLDDGFERGELHHGIRDLTAPQRVYAFVETVRVRSVIRSTPAYDDFDVPGDAFGSDDLGDAVEGALGEGWHGRLHADFDGFEGTESKIGYELGGGGTG